MPLKKYVANKLCRTFTFGQLQILSTLDVNFEAVMIMVGNVQLRINSKTFDERLCIICDTVNLKSEAHGRTKIMEYADKKRDIVWERLKQIDNAPFKFHMDNTCYKFYTHKNH